MPRGTVARVPVIKEWQAGVVFAFVNAAFLVLASKPFTIFTGINVLGHTLIYSVPESLAALAPLRDPTSLGDIGLFLGAAVAAALAGEARLRYAPVGDYLHVALGGALMALGVALSWGCNWGGFLSAITALSLHGYAMLPGLVLGGLLGARYVEWRTRRMLESLELLEGPAPGPRASERIDPRWPIIATLLAVAAAFLASGPAGAAALALGFIVGVTIQRSRFCFATAFRDFLGGPEAARAARLQLGIATAIVIGATLAAALKYMGVVDPYAYIKPAGLSNFLGGILFAFGAVIAGSCASGMLWRAGEGHVKALVAIGAAVTVYPIAKEYLRPLALEYIGAVKFPLFAVGYLEGLLLIYVTMGLWALLAIYLLRRWGTHG